MSKALDMINSDRKKIVDKLIENMEKGYFLSKDEWDKFAIRPQNPVSNLSYKGVNRLKLSLAASKEDYKDPRWVTFNQARDKGWNIKKGAKSVLCEKWVFTKNVKEKDSNGKVIEKTVKLERPFPNYFRVFNGEQVEGIPELKFESLKDKKILDIADTFIKSSECKISEVAQDRAYYTPSKDTITLPLREVFKDESSFLKTLLHEMGHSTGHPDRLDRSMKGVFGSPEYAREELNAELSAIFIQGDLGMTIEGEHLNDHSDYLKSWIAVLKKDYNELFRACSSAEKIAERLYKNYEEVNDRSHDNVNEKIDKEKNFKAKPFDKLRVTLNWSELDLGVEAGSKLKGKEAYDFLKKVMLADKRINLERINDPLSQSYYKVNMSVEYGNFTKEDFRIDLGDKEFGGHTKVSNGLEFRFKSWTKELVENLPYYSELYNITPEKLNNDVKETNKEIDKAISHLKTKEKEVMSKSKTKAKNKGMER